MKNDTTSWATRYELAYNSVYESLPTWKRNEVDTGDDSRICKEFCQEVVRAAETFKVSDPPSSTDSGSFSGKAVPDPHAWD